MQQPGLIRTARSVSALTLPELLISAAVTSVIAAGLLTALSALQKSASASQHHATSQLNQARIMDYISRDLRRALTVAVDTTEGGERLTVTIPEYRATDGRPRDPVIVGESVTYGPAGSSIAVSYYRRADVFYRSVNGAETALATGVSDFEPDFTDGGAQTVSVTVSFQSRYRFGSDISVRTGTQTSSTTLLRNQRN